jgi:hypothetical protein
MSYLANKKAVIFFGIITLIMAYIVMVIVGPMIDKKDGFSVIALQLAFFKENGLKIVSTWDIEAFKKWIFTDYIYALSYMLFFSSLALWLAKVKQTTAGVYPYIAIMAGVFDWIEDTLELWFLNSLESFPSTLFFIHSIFSTLKWLALPLFLWGLIKLIRKKKDV